MLARRQAKLMQHLLDEIRNESDLLNTFRPTHAVHSCSCQDESVIFITSIKFAESSVQISTLIIGKHVVKDI